MTTVSRRKLLGYSVMLGAGLPGLSLSSGLQAKPDHMPPLGTWLLSRLIERQLNDGNFISVSRTWEVQFHARPNGYEVVGKQIDVGVKAPESLAELAQLEKRRKSGLLPIEITAHGLISSAGSADTDTGEDLANAVAAAKEIMVKAGASQTEQNQARQFMKQLQSAAHPLLDNLPPDLFFPSDEKVKKTDTVQLPDGTYGRFHLEYWGKTQDGSSLLHTAQRIITTAIGQSSRISRETWMLKPR